MANSKVDNKAQVATTATTTGFDPDAVKVVKNVTLPLLKKEDDTPIYIKSIGAIFKGKQVNGKDAEKMEPADLMNIINLETGEEMQVICNSVMKSTFNEEYPGDGYIGKCFRVTQMKVEGKRYKNYSIAEIEV